MRSLVLKTTWTRRNESDCGMTTIIGPKARVIPAWANAPGWDGGAPLARKRGGRRASDVRTADVHRDSCGPKAHPIPAWGNAPGTVGKKTGLKARFMVRRIQGVSASSRTRARAAWVLAQMRVIRSWLAATRARSASLTPAPTPSRCRRALPARPSRRRERPGRVSSPENLLPSRAALPSRRPWPRPDRPLPRAGA